MTGRRRGRGGKMCWTFIVSISFIQVWFLEISKDERERERERERKRERERERYERERENERDW